MTKLWNQTYLIFYISFLRFLGGKPAYRRTSILKLGAKNLSTFYITNIQIRFTSNASFIIDILSNLFVRSTMERLARLNVFLMMCGNAIFTKTLFNEGALNVYIFCTVCDFTVLFH